MKNLMFVFVSATLALVQASEARSVRVPTRESQMEIKTANGVFTHVKSVVLTETKLGDESNFFITIDGQATELTVQDVKSADCGSTRLLLKQKIAPNARYYAFLRVDLLDHTQRECEDNIPYLWNAKVTRESLLHHEQNSEMTVVGNPKLIPDEPAGSVVEKQADLKITKAEGYYANVKSLSIQQVSIPLSSVEYIAQIKNTDGQPYSLKFRMVKSKTGGCNIKTKTLSAEPGRSGLKGLTATLVDATENRCRHIVPHWNLRIDRYSRNPADAGTVAGYGNIMARPL